MAPDDPEGGIRELRFKHGSDHVIVTASPDGKGDVRVLDDFYRYITGTSKKLALKATLKLISVARRWVFEEFVREGGTVAELREDTGPVDKPVDAVDKSDLAVDDEEK